jgi:hypothetical protein
MGLYDAIFEESSLWYESAHKKMVLHDLKEFSWCGTRFEIIYKERNQIFAWIFAG